MRDTEDMLMGLNMWAGNHVMLHALLALQTYSKKLLGSQRSRRSHVHLDIIYQCSAP